MSPSVIRIGGVSHFGTAAVRLRGHYPALSATPHLTRDSTGNGTTRGNGDTENRAKITTRLSWQVNEWRVQIDVEDSCSTIFSREQTLVCSNGVVSSWLWTLCGRVTSKTQPVILSCAHFHILQSRSNKQFTTTLRFVLKPFKCPRFFPTPLIFKTQIFQQRNSFPLSRLGWVGLSWVWLGWVSRRIVVIMLRGSSDAPNESPRGLVSRSALKAGVWHYLSKKRVELSRVGRYFIQKSQEFKQIRATTVTLPCTLPKRIKHNKFRRLFI